MARKMSDAAFLANLRRQRAKAEKLLEQFSGYRQIGGSIDLTSSTREIIANIDKMIAEVEARIAKGS